MEIFEFLSYGFAQRALLAGSFIAVLCSVLGVFLVLKRLSLIGDGLGHVTFGAVALSLLLKAHPLYVSIPLVMLSSLGILRLTKRARIHGDAAVGVVSSLGIAIGILLASTAEGFNIDLFGYLFGNILSISRQEVIISMVLSVAVLFTVLFFYYDLFSITFDEDSAKASGVKTDRINTILILLTALTVVLAMRVVGIMLVSALLILPAVTSMQIARGFKATMAVAVVSSLLSVIGGIFISFEFDLPTGATIVIMNFLLLISALAYRRLRGKLQE
ncbi:MAG: metal ABC transporter permease [Nitrospirae bacterium]|nr:metal ABC transporter permease [Nitrospirota bacterium]